MTQHEFIDRFRNGEYTTEKGKEYFILDLERMIYTIEKECEKEIAELKDTISELSVELVAYEEAQAEMQP